MVCNSARVRRGSSPAKRRSSRRGFAVLLYSYLVTFFLFAFTTSLLTRSSLELSHAERSANIHQAFWAAEGVLEESITALQTAEPTLLAGQCLENFQTTAMGNIRGNSRLCLDAVRPLAGGQEQRDYRIEGTGTAPRGASHTLSATVEYTARVLYFNHMVASDHVHLSNMRLGGMDTRLSTIPANTNSMGDVASFRTTMANCNGTPCAPIWLMNGSRVEGTAYVGPGGSLSTLISVSANSQLGGRANLPEVPSLPSIEAPSGAVDLATVLTHDAQGRITTTQLIPPGIYTVSMRLTVRGNADVCTSGKVEIYASDGLDIFPVAGGSLYGQPDGNTTCADRYMPFNLRIFHEGTEAFRVAGVNETQPTLMAAIVYAPNARLFRDGNFNFTWVGGIIMGAGTSMRLRVGQGLFYYDEALRNQPIRVGPATIRVKWWTAVTEASSTVTSY